MKKFKVVVTNKVNLAAIDKMKDLFELNIRQKDTDEAVFSSWLKEADAIYSPSMMKIDAALLDKAPNLKVVSQVSVGYDNIDVDYCTKRGIKVGNTPGVVTDAAADAAYGLILCSSRYLHSAWLHVKNGAWGERKPFVMGHDLKDKVLGIVGMGAVGFAVAKRALASKMKIVYYNRKPSSLADSVCAKYLPFDQLLQTADFVLATVPLTGQTEKMFGYEQFCKMKDTARFINIARGKVVDTEGLYKALIDKKIAYAAFDVTDPEPLPGSSKLLELDNVVVFPHIGGYTIETRDAMSLMALDNLIAGLQGDKMPSCVNDS